MSTDTTPAPLESPLARIHGALTSLLADVSTAAQSAEQHGAAILTSLQASLAPLEQQLGSLVAGQAITLEQQAVILITAKINAALPAIIAGVTADLNAVIVAAGVVAKSEVAALGVKVAAEGAVAL